MKTNTDFLKQIVQYPLDKTQYFQEKYTKRQIVIHHTASNGNAKNVITGWRKNKERVGVAFVIDHEGIIHQAFSSAHWAHHLGTQELNNTLLNKQSIGIELCNWGQLKLQKSKYVNYLNQEIPLDEVYVYDSPFRGSFYFQKYTGKQLESLKNLINYLTETYNIPKDYKKDMWDISRLALAGSPGIYTHVSFRKDKSDCHPQVELINVTKDLK
jgi:N-acetyl-anhydromuramyl-L-alanine amidase AmpD